MKRILIIFSALPIIASLVMAHLMGWRVLNRVSKLSYSLEDILNKLGVFGVEHELVKRAWAPMPISKNGKALILEKHLDSKDTHTVSAELLKVGLAEINKTHPEMIAYRLKVLKAGYFIPPFILLGGSLALIVKRIPPGWFVAGFAISLAVTCVMLWLSRTVEKEAAKEIQRMLEKKRILNRLTEEEALIESLYAWTWISILPGMLVSLLTAINKSKKTESIDE